MTSQRRLRLRLLPIRAGCGRASAPAQTSLREAAQALQRASSTVALLAPPTSISSPETTTVGGLIDSDARQCGVALHRRSHGAARARVSRSAGPRWHRATIPALRRSIGAVPPDVLGLPGDHHLRHRRCPGAGARDDRAAKMLRIEQRIHHDRAAQCRRQAATGCRPRAETKVAARTASSAAAGLSADRTLTCAAPASVKWDIVAQQAKAWPPESGLVSCCGPFLFGQI